MPTVAVYVPAHVFRGLGGDADLVRQIAVRALEFAVASGGKPGGLGAGDPEAVSFPAVASVEEVASPEAATSRRASPAPSSPRFASGLGKCSADVARGTRCKLCGEKH
jgi:hypothetical protein